MSVELLLFVIAILLVSIFWTLSKINTLLKKTLVIQKQDHERTKKEQAGD